MTVSQPVTGARVCLVLKISPSERCIFIYILLNKNAIGRRIIKDHDCVTDYAHSNDVDLSVHAVVMMNVILEVMFCL
jgi:hypothetical protein